ncbi:MAG: ATP-binding cassette domain-containing protein [Terracidiphilus sp.]
MLELALSARRGSFHLQVDCRLAAEWTVIFGPSGAGKTTLLRLLAGLDRRRASEQIQGYVKFDSEMLTETSQALWRAPGRRQIAFVTQQPALFPHLTAAENVAYGLRPLDPAKRAARVNEMLELVDATDLASRRPGDLSGGQAQRIALARALATHPRLLLLDEPFSALDGVASDALLERLKGWLKGRGVQAVLATHDVSDALVTGAEVLLLREGRLAAQGPAAEVLADERERLLGRLGPV